MKQANKDICLDDLFNWTVDVDFVANNNYLVLIATDLDKDTLCDQQVHLQSKVFVLIMGNCM